MQKKKVNKLSMYFMVCFVPFFWAKLIQLTTFIDYSIVNQICDGIIKIFGFANLCLIVNCKIPRKIFAPLVGSFLAILLSGYLSEDWQYIWILGFVVTAHLCDFKKIARFVCISYIAILIITFICSSTGIIVNTITYGITRTRYGMGFIFTSIGGIIITRIALLLLYLKRKKINLFDVSVLMGASIFYYLKTKTRAPFAIIILLVFIIYSTKWFDKIFKNKLWKKIVKNSIIVAPIFSFLIVIMYSPSSPILNAINILLSSRLSITQRAIASNGISLFGQTFVTVGTGTWTASGEVIQEAGWLYNVVDSSYILYAMKYGLAFLTIIILLYYFCCKYSIEKNDIYVQIILIILIFYGIFEPQLFRLEYNPFILLLGNGFFYKNNNALEHVIKKNRAGRRQYG